MHEVMKLQDLQILYAHKTYFLTLIEQMLMIYMIYTSAYDIYRSMGHMQITHISIHISL